MRSKEIMEIQGYQVLNLRSCLGLFAY